MIICFMHHPTTTTTTTNNTNTTNTTNTTHKLPDDLERSKTHLPPQKKILENIFLSQFSLKWRKGWFKNWSKKITPHPLKKYHSSPNNIIYSQKIAKLSSNRQFQLKLNLVSFILDSFHYTNWPLNWFKETWVRLSTSKFWGHLPEFKF